MAITSNTQAATSSGESVLISLGSTRQASGTSAQPSIVTIRRRDVSLIAHECRISAPLPIVVGIITVGGVGWVTRSKPS